MRPVEPVPSVGQATVPPALRGPVTVAIVVAAAVVVVLSVRYAGGTTPRWLDVRIDSLVELVPGHPRAWSALLELGNPLVAVAAPTVLAASAYVCGRRRLALLAVLGPGLTGAAVFLLKPLVGRTLRGDFAFPSGQTAAATACGLVAGLLLISVLRVDRWAAGLYLGLAVVASGGTTALALIIRHWHYSTDTVGGLCTGIAVVLGTALCCDRVAVRRTRKRACSDPTAD